MSKAKDKIQVRINRDPRHPDIEEVFLYREEPYLNEVKYAKPGVYKEGEFAESTVEKKEG